MLDAGWVVQPDGCVQEFGFERRLKQCIPGRIESGLQAIGLGYRPELTRAQKR